MEVAAPHRGFQLAAEDLNLAQQLQGTVEVVTGEAISATFSSEPCATSDVTRSLSDASAPTTKKYTGVEKDNLTKDRSGPTP